MAAFSAIVLLCIISCVFMDGTESGNSRVKEKRFMLSKNKKNFYAAMADCNRRGKRLVRVDSQEEQTNLVKLIKSHMPNESIWTSGSDLGGGDYVWLSNGLPFTYTNWISGEPDHGKTRKNEHCVCIWAYDLSSGNFCDYHWGDFVCTYDLHYVCESFDILDL